MLETKDQLKKLNDKVTTDSNRLINHSQTVAEYVRETRKEIIKDIKSITPEAISIDKHLKKQRNIIIGSMLIVFILWALIIVYTSLQ